ncbi:hypothetical protein A0J61_00701 [Choanephora cucurbitarum]|uniref:Mediator of RNA polymerase II transcription subunit 19 n=1 Tax=Choanephora cucurbitarum TaxID=101091 RepID=A0A1C7NQP2_9FUNG|nr:hypothetical protein A0J61_00701 [Choanephora cucurbitarum]
MSGQLTGSHDLLSYFNLIPIYNKVVKANRGVELDPTLSKYISDLPASGRQDMEYDGYLLNLLRDPQAIETGPSIRPLDADTLRDAFSLKEGPIPGFDASVLGTDDTSVTPHPSGYAVERDQYGNAITDVDYNGERKHKKKVLDD